MKKLLVLILFACIKVDAQIITTVAGNGTSGSSGDGGQATAASFEGPNYVVFDADNNLYIADSGSATIRMVNATGIISSSVQAAAEIRSIQRSQTKKLKRVS